MAKIENIHCTICIQPISSSWQNTLPPAFASLEQRGVKGHNNSDETIFLDYSRILFKFLNFTISDIKPSFFDVDESVCEANDHYCQQPMKTIGNARKQSGARHNFGASWVSDPWAAGRNSVTEMFVVSLVNMVLYSGFRANESNEKRERAMISIS